VGPLPVAHFGGDVWHAGEITIVVRLFTVARNKRRAEMFWKPPCLHKLWVSAPDRPSGFKVTGKIGQLALKQVVEGLLDKLGRQGLRRWWNSLTPPAAVEFTTSDQVQSGILGFRHRETYLSRCSGPVVGCNRRRARSSTSV
jgi:hypothetical protein